MARRRRLLAVAGLQEGLFTVDQAAAAGLDRRARHHHLSYGNWRRTDAPEVFRLAGWPPDRHERLRAWLLWAGPGALLTSWTALGLLRLCGAGPRVPVDLEVPFRCDRSGVRRRQRMLRQIRSTGRLAPVHLHPAVRSRDVVVDGMAVRPAPEAICAAANHRPRSIAVGMASALLERGHLSEQDLFVAVWELGCSPLMELFFQRRSE